MNRSVWVVITLLFLLIMFSLALNGFLIWQLLIFRQQAQALVQQAQDFQQQAQDFQQRAQDLQRVALEWTSRFRQELATFDEAVFEYAVQIDEQIPVEAIVPFQEHMQVPFQTTIPIDEEIETTVVLEVTQLGVSIPVDVTIPVALEVPIDISVPVDIDRQVSVRTTVPLELEVPIVIRLSETDLAQYVELLDQGLEELERALSETW